MKSRVSSAALCCAPPVPGMDPQRCPARPPAALPTCALPTPLPSSPAQRLAPPLLALSLAPPVTSRRACPMSGALSSSPAPSGHELRPARGLKAAAAMRSRSAMSRAVLVLLCAGLGACLAAGTTGRFGAGVRREVPLRRSIPLSRCSVLVGAPSAPPSPRLRVKFGLRRSADAEDEGCALELGSERSLEECGFNATARTFLIIHGWTVSGGIGSVAGAVIGRFGAAAERCSLWGALHRCSFTELKNAAVVELNNCTPVLHHSVPLQGEHRQRNLRFVP